MFVEHGVRHTDVNLQLVLFAVRVCVISLSDQDVVRLSVLAVDERHLDGLSDLATVEADNFVKALGRMKFVEDFNLIFNVEASSFS